MQLDDILPVDSEETVDLKSLYTSLGSLEVEFKQMNRAEKQRLEAFREFFDDEKKAKQQLLTRIDALLSRAEESDLRALLLSVIEIRDFVETFQSGLPAAFAGKNPLLQWLAEFSTAGALAFVTDTVRKTIRKIDLSLEKAGVIPIHSDDAGFDPTTMTAVETVNDATRPEMTVVETVETGFLHHNRVLRPARVTVNKSV